MRPKPTAKMVCECCKRRDATRELVAEDKTTVRLCEECYEHEADLVRELGFRGTG